MGDGDDHDGHPEEVTLLDYVVGDLAQIQDEVKKLGWGDVVVLDKSGVKAPAP